MWWVSGRWRVCGCLLMLCNCLCGFCTVLTGGEDEGYDGGGGVMADTGRAGMTSGVSDSDSQ